MSLDDLFAERDRLERAYSGVCDLLPCYAREYPFTPARERLEEIEDDIKEMVK